MRVKDFKVYTTKKGAIACIDLDFEAEVKIDMPIHMEYFSGLSNFDILKLNGELSFSSLSIKTVLLREKEEAEKAVKEIKTLLQDLEYRETVEINRLLAVEQYIKSEFKEYIQKDNKE